MCRQNSQWKRTFQTKQKSKDFLLIQNILEHITGLFPYFWPIFNSKGKKKRIWKNKKSSIRLRNQFYLTRIQSSVRIWIKLRSFLFYDYQCLIFFKKCFRFITIWSVRPMDNFFSVFKNIFIWKPLWSLSGNLIVWISCCAYL